MSEPLPPSPDHESPPENQPTDVPVADADRRLRMAREMRELTAATRRAIASSLPYLKRSDAS
jgi:hypothetical protein